MIKMLCIVLCLLLCTPCALAQQAPQLLEPAGVQLNATEVFRGPISKISVTEGAIVPYVEDFFFEQEGVIDVVHVIVGQQVKTGDPLITLDTEDEQERMKTLRRQIEQLKRNSAYEDELAQIDLDILDVELRALMKQTPADESAVMLKRLDIEEKKLNMELNARLRTLELNRLTSELELLEAEVARNVLYAPFDGRVAYMTDQWQHGSYVSAFTPLLYLADDSQLFVESDFISNSVVSFANDIYAHVGDKRYQLTPTALDEREYLAKVLSGETLMRTFTIDEPDDSLQAGQFAAVCVETNYVPDALLVPSNTLYAAEKVRYVYVLENGVRVRRDVKVGITTDWYTQITEGLEEGELIYVQE